MTSRRKANAALSPIPKVVEVTPDDTQNTFLRYGSSTPGKMAKTASVVTPLSLFQDHGRYFKQQESLDISIDTDNESSIASRLGIRKPSYRGDDEASRQSGSSFRIGITRPSYELPEGDIPLSPLNLYLQKKATSPTPNLVELDSEDSADPFVEWNNIERISEVPSRDEDDAVEVKQDDDSIERMVHEHTAEGHYLISSTPVTKPRDDIQFSLTKGRHGLPKAMRRASQRHLARNPRPAQELVRMGAPDASFKIFVLLLNPLAKIFELIQVIYAPSITTIGDILAMIPANATEPALGSQSYVGLCRPKDGIEIRDMELMASGSHCKMSCARITRGEILVAISTGFSGERCATLAVPILANQRILKLLKRSDPLAADRNIQRRRSRGSHRSGSSRSRVETVKEEPEDEKSPSRKEVKEAMKHAVAAAAAANAAVLDDDQEDFVASSNSSINVTEQQWRSSTALDLAASLTFDSADRSMNDSLASSVASNNSSSFQTGMNSTFTFQSGSRRLPRRRVTRRKHLRTKRNYYVGRISAVAMLVMVGVFIHDADAPRNRDDMTKVFGLIGFLQFLAVFCALVKFQLFVGGKGAIKCPFLRATVDAAVHIQERIAETHSKQEYA